MSEGMRAFVRVCLLASSTCVCAAHAFAQETAAPVFSPGEGVYRAAQTVSISDTTVGAKIYYTIDGSEPTRSSTPYTGAGITISSSATLRALAMTRGDTGGARTVAVYRIVPLTAKPVFSPAQGAYRSPQAVSISDATPGATIYYTTDGTLPDLGANEYKGVLNVGSDATLLAIAIAPGYSPSPTAVANYEIAPSFDIQVSVLYDFSANANDPFEPVGPLIQGSDGNFYGMSNSGGAYFGGTVFEITPGGVETTLHSFPAGGILGVDGSTPTASLVEGSDGDLYGTTSSGGQIGEFGSGTVFKITKAGVETVLHSFTGSPLDGADPNAALIQGSDGNFYGTTTLGGAYGNGTVFKITPAGVETVLYSFNNNPPYFYGDDAPETGLIDGGDGFYYGTTGPVIYKITAAGEMTTIGQISGELCVGLVLGADGLFYGATQSYGFQGNWGHVFKITRTGVMTVLYAFGANSVVDGENPMAPLIQGPDGNFYGTTVAGGSYGYGTVFSITPTGAERVLYTFAPAETLGDNLSWLALGRDGNIYGTAQANGPTRPDCTFMGAPRGCGTVFKMTGVFPGEPRGRDSIPSVTIP
jgi:uncharacterized repeat protein (TIGR03803 family)